MAAVDRDVVVIGAGLAGLATAAHLARDGVGTLVCERHERPGGYFASFTRDGYTFDAGIQGCEDVGLLSSTLERLGLRDRIELRRSRVGLALPGAFTTLREPADLAAFYGHFKAAFPRHAAAIDRVTAEALRFSAVMDGLAAAAPNHGPRAGRTRKLRVLAQLPRFLRLLRTPIEEYLGRLIDDEQLVRLLAVGYRGNPAPLSLVFIPTMMDYRYPVKGGMQAIPDALAACVREHGGEVRCRASVDGIVVENGRAAGVVLESGEIIRSRCVVNTGDFRRTLTNMLPEGYRPRRQLDRAVRSRLGDSVFSVYLGVDLRPEDVPTDGCPHVFLVPSYERRSFASIDTDPDFYANELLMVSIPTLLDPALAPPGKSVVILQCAASIRSFDRWGTAGDGPSGRSEEVKRRVAAQLVANAERLIPGLSDRIEVQETSTPLTLQRYTLNADGAATGWTYHPREAYRGGLRGLLGRSNTGVENLYQVGHWTMSPGGAPAALITSRLASATIARRIRAGKI